MERISCGLDNLALRERCRQQVPLRWDFLRGFCWHEILIGRQHREAILGKVAVKGERGGNTKPLHHGKARGVGEGEVFIIVLVDNGLGTLYISRRHPHQGGRVCSIS